MSATTQADLPAARSASNFHDSACRVSSPTSAFVSYPARRSPCRRPRTGSRSEENTSELQSLRHCVCRLLLEKKANQDSCCQSCAPSELIYGSANARVLL